MIILRILHNRALQIYYTHGLTKSELIVTKNSSECNFQVPLRYKNVCLFALNCQTESDIIYFS